MGGREAGSSSLTHKNPSPSIAWKMWLSKGAITIAIPSFPPLRSRPGYMGPEKDLNLHPHAKSTWEEKRRCTIILDRTIGEVVIGIATVIQALRTKIRKNERVYWLRVTNIASFHDVGSMGRWITDSERRIVGSTMLIDTHGRRRKESDNEEKGLRILRMVFLLKTG